ncbi:Arylsulphatase [Thozetella sp. PMI_491]|nr:Arylsulphatase [Thozetella sp. PMI_491]
MAARAARELENFISTRAFGFCRLFATKELNFIRISAEGLSPSSGRRKNIVVILADDQDDMLNSTSFMPRLRQHVIEQGTHFTNHFTTTAICCPARVSLWTGKQPHNTNVTDVDPPYGGFPKFISQGLNEAYLPIWLQEAGYATYYTGKMFNSHSIHNYDSPHLKGWTGSNFLLDPGTYSYLDPIFQRDHDAPIHHHGRHTTDLIQEHVAELLHDALGSDKPFFLVAAPIAPHSNIDSNTGGPPLMTEPIPLRRHQFLFADERIPRTSNFNPDSPSGVSWVSKLPKLNDTAVDYLDHFFRQRLRALQGVDELVEQVIIQLEDAGVLNDTYIIYSSDNGYHLGQHRLPPGKECGFEEDIRVPLFIRGPGVAKGHTESSVSAHIDLTPTIFAITGIDLRSDFDGTPIRLPTESGAQPNHIQHEHVAVEYWGTAIAEGALGGWGGKGKIVMPNNTYKALRVKSDSYDIYYAVWCSNERELYDIKRDPGQMDNLYPSKQLSNAWSQPFIGSQLGLVIARLDALLMVMKSCKGQTCVQPWKSLHPAGDVHSLREALDSHFDEFYRDQIRVSFGRCEPGYIIEAEGPQMRYEFH